jgi:hypothetical protein
MKMDDTDILDDVGIEEITQEELDALYAREMWALTGTEREDILYDIHGVAEQVKETPEFCTQQIHLLENELYSLVSRRPHKETGAYFTALQQNEAYVKSLQLMFLRADRWKPREAADRMISFFTTKLALFGSSSLTEHITIDRHLSKDDREALESGFFQLLTVRDTTGRAILMGIPPLRNYKHPDNLVRERVDAQGRFDSDTYIYIGRSSPVFRPSAQKRAFFYIVMMALEDVETQTAGVVMVGFNMGSKRVVDRKAAFAVQSTKRVLPFRVVSIHYCYDDVRFRVMMTLGMLMMGASRRVRFRAHFGNYKDVLYKLSTFGIPSSALPIAPDGEPKFKSHRTWLKQRNGQERKQAMGNLPLSIVVVPGRFDILLGRGKPIQGKTLSSTVETRPNIHSLTYISLEEHFGNIRYHSLLDHYQDAYDRSLKFQKMKISQKILDTVAEYEGRFLKEEGAGWVEVDSVATREKVGHAFRTRRASALGNSSLASKAPANKSSGQLTMETIPERIAPIETAVKVTPNEAGIILRDAEQESLQGSTTGNNGKRLRL